jgi:hypothetical protein
MKDAIDKEWLEDSVVIGQSTDMQVTPKPHVCTSLVHHDGSLGEYLNCELYQFSIQELLCRNTKRFRGGLD